MNLLFCVKKNVIARACRELGYHVTVEPFKINGVALDSKRVDLDIMMGLKSVIADVTIRCSARKDVDKVMEAAEANKESKYQAMSKHRVAEIVPIAIDAFGGVAKKAREFFKRMKQTGVARSSDKTVAGIMRTMQREISVAIHRYNAKCFMTGVAASMRKGAAS